MVELNNIYQEEWKKMYPGVEFPTPQKYPHMFPEGAYTQQNTIYVDLFGSECSHPSVCKKGLIDYKCQIEK